MRDTTVRAPWTCASISGDSSTATTEWPSAINGWVTRPAPHPSSRIDALGGDAASMIAGSSRAGTSA